MTYVLCLSYKGTVGDLTKVKWGKMPAALVGSVRGAEREAAASRQT